MSDTSAIRALAQLDLLPTLGSLFGVVLLPPAVAAELRVRVPGLPVIDPADMPFFRIQAPAGADRVQELAQQLDHGEAEAIVLALEIGADAILIDEAAGRRVAKRLGLLPLGVLGVLVKAKRAGHVARVGPLMDRLEAELGFRLSVAVRRAVLELAGD